MFLIRGCGEGSPLDGSFSDNKGPYKEPDVKNQSIGTHNGWRDPKRKFSEELEEGWSCLGSVERTDFSFQYVAAYLLKSKLLIHKISSCSFTHAFEHQAMALLQILLHLLPSSHTHTHTHGQTQACGGRVNGLVKDIANASMFWGLTDLCRGSNLEL